jgi:AcrR family transcriptional regulator
MPAPPGAGRGTARANPASYHRQIADRNAQAILDAAEELLRLEGHTSISAVAALAGVSPSTRTSRPGRPCWKRRCSAR